MKSTDSILVVLFTFMLTLSGIPVSGQGVTGDVNIVCTNAVIDVTPGQSSEGSIMCEIENPSSHRIKGNITIDSDTLSASYSWDHNADNIWIESGQSVILYYQVGAPEGSDEGQHIITITFTVNQANGVSYPGNPESYNSLGIIQQYNIININVDNDNPIMHLGDEISFDVNITNLGNALTRFNIYLESGSKFIAYSLYSLEIERNMTETLIVVVSPIENACENDTDFYEEQFLLGVWPDLQDMAESIEYYESVLMLECTPDSDNDGLRDDIDLDDDNDGWSDEQESECGTNLLLSQSTPIDTDSDNLCDFIDMDDDGDGWSDSVEESCNSNTLNSTSLPLDTDSNGICDPLDDDDDGDGWPDGLEAYCNSNTLNSTSLPLDTDSDGFCDSLDDDDDGDGWTDSVEASCNSNTLNSTSLPLDTDSDGICNSLDDDDDGDGWSDSVEASCNSNTLNSTSLPLDTDSDGICNSLDNDDDDDGILDQLDVYPLDRDRYLTEPIDETNSSIIVILLLVIATLLIVIFRIQKQ